VSFQENICRIFEIYQGETVHSPIELILLSVTIDDGTMFSPYEVSRVPKFQSSYLYPQTGHHQRGSFVPQIAAIVSKN
jgi:hypothetical protein